jgi:hypothetical protein
VSAFSTKPFFRKLDRLLTAMAHAEAGDLDAVKAILEQDRVTTPVAAPETPVSREVKGAKIIEFKRAKPAF